MRVLKMSALSLLLLLPLGCIKNEVYTYDEEICLIEKLTDLLNHNVTISDYQQKGSIVTFAFSNGIDISIECTSSPVFTLGVQGYWMLNGKLTDSPLDSTNVKDYLGKDGPVLGIIEGYEDWTIYTENEIITFRKSLFSSNPDSKIRGINHRGYSVSAPENTLPAFRLSKLNGFRYVEADVWFTSDDVPVLIHDATVDRTSNGSGSVSKMCFEELRRLDFGGWKSSVFLGTQIPSLEEFITLCLDIDLYPYIELKTGTRAQIESVVTMVELYGLKDKAVYISFSPVLLKYVVDFEPTASIGFLVGAPFPEASIQTTLGLMTGLNYVFIDTSDYSDDAVTLCKNASIPMEVWTIDSKSVIKNLSPYISGVTSNQYHAGRVMEEP